MLRTLTEVLSTMGQNHRAEDVAKHFYFLEVGIERKDCKEGPQHNLKSKRNNGLHNFESLLDAGHKFVEAARVLARVGRDVLAHLLAARRRDERLVVNVVERQVELRQRRVRR